MQRIGIFCVRQAECGDPPAESQRYNGNSKYERSNRKGMDERDRRSDRMAVPASDRAGKRSAASHPHRFCKTKCVGVMREQKKIGF